MSVATQTETERYETWIGLTRNSPLVADEPVPTLRGQLTSTCLSLNNMPLRILITDLLAHQQSSVGRLGRRGSTRREDGFKILLVGVDQVLDPAMEAVASTFVLSEYERFSSTCGNRRLYSESGAVVLIAYNHLQEVGMFFGLPCNFAVTWWCCKEVGLNSGR